MKLQIILHKTTDCATLNYRQNYVVIYVHAHYTQATQVIRYTICVPYSFLYRSVAAKRNAEES